MKSAKTTQSSVLRILICLCLLFCLLHQSDCKYHMSSTSMKEIIQFEKKLAKDFLRYYYDELARLDALEKFINQTVNFDATDYADSLYVSNIVNALALLKRYVHGWENFTRFERRPYRSHALRVFLDQYERRFRDKTELRGSVYAIMKIQETYMMTSAEFLDLYKDRYSQSILTSDVCTIGIIAMDMKYFGISQTWLLECYHRYKTTKDTILHPYTIDRLLESLIWSADALKDWNSALFHAERQLELTPNSEEAHKKVDYYRYQAQLSKQQNGVVKQTQEEKYAFQNYNGREWLTREYKLCRGGGKLNDKDIKRLSCRYTRPSPEFIIKPLKQELAYHTPKIYYYHNLLTDGEVDELLVIAREKLKRAEVVNFSSGTILTANYRISRNAWFSGWHHKIVTKIMKRVGKVTNLNMYYTEPLQIGNYGIGGNYESHWDHATPPNNYTIFGNYGWGNRLATVLLYLSDVEVGGNTVFVESGPGVSVSAKKGSAVVWFNLKRNGEGDFMTRHAGCPVLLGEKWVANLWIHEWGQELTRPCPLNQKDYSKRYSI